MGLGGRRALAVGLPASVNAGRVGVLRLKLEVKQERVPSMEEPREITCNVTCIRHVRRVTLK